MRIFGSISELVSVIMRKNTYAITLRPSSSTTYTADRIVDIPPGDQASVLVGATNTQTLSNKTVTSSVVGGGTASDTNKLVLGSETTSGILALDPDVGSIHLASDGIRPLLADGNQFQEISAHDWGRTNYIKGPNYASSWDVLGGIVVSTATGSDGETSGMGSYLQVEWDGSSEAYAYTRFTTDAVDNVMEVYARVRSSAGLGVASFQLWTNSLSNYTGTYTQVTLLDGTLEYNLGSSGGERGFIFDNQQLGSPGYYEFRINWPGALSAETLYINDLVVTPHLRAGLNAGTDISSISLLPAGYVGETEEVSPTNFSQNTPTEDTYYDVSGASLALGRGIWRLEAYGVVGMVSSSNANAFLAIRSGSAIIADGCVSHTASATSVYGPICISAVVGGSTTYKLSIKARKIGGAPTYTSVSYHVGGDYTTTPYIRATRIG